jgi:hypothetical protein
VAGNATLAVGATGVNGGVGGGVMGIVAAGAAGVGSGAGRHARSRKQRGKRKTTARTCCHERCWNATCRNVVMAIAGRQVALKIRSMLVKSYRQGGENFIK